MDATAVDLASNNNATLTVCQAQILPGGCMEDAEDPTCAKLSITGRATAPGALLPPPPPPAHQGRVIT